jgi:hypothetical protein
MELSRNGQAKFLDTGLLKLDPLGYDDQSYNTEVCDRLIAVNDNSHFPEKYREKRITALFKRVGIKVRFVGK